MRHHPTRAGALGVSNAGGRKEEAYVYRQGIHGSQRIANKI